MRTARSPELAVSDLLLQIRFRSPHNIDLSVAPGESVGYANAFVCASDMTIAVVACGYADGYPRHKIETAQVAIAGQACDVVGRVSMDMITVDVTGLEEVRVGDEVTLFGGAPDVNDLADASQTIAYEILCNVGAHARREYIE